MIVFSPNFSVQQLKLYHKNDQKTKRFLTEMPKTLNIVSIGYIERGGAPMSGYGQGSSGFALIVVLFILLIIVGAAYLY